jgi:hypothetical protein
MTPTTTISNPKNKGAYSLEAVPANGTEESRFALGTTSEGWAVSRKIDAVANAYTKLVADRKAEAPPLQPEFKEIELKYVGLSTTGEYVTVPRGTVRAIPTKEPTASGRFKKLKATGGALIDEAMLGADVRPDALWNALLELATAERPEGRTLRDLNDAVAELVLIQSGLDVDKRSLPQEHLR